MSTTKRLLLLTTLAAAAIVACGGDDDNPAAPDIPVPSTPIDEDAGADAGPSASTFPKFVEQSILTKTNDTSAPDPESAWGALPDDEAYAAPPGFF